MADLLRWGILGTGNIAKQFAAGMATSRRGRVVAVGSRSGETASAFARQFSLNAAHAKYEALLNDPQVDAIYLSLPNSMHHEWTLKALAAGKHVLCEKPMASNAAQAAEMFQAAKSAGKLLVEAFMYRSHPQTQAVLKAIRSGRIGEIRAIKTSFCYRTTKLVDNIRFRADLAGGSMMDVGCYCLDFARLVTGEEPRSVLATGRLHSSGVDECAAGTLHFPSGVLATFVCGMTLQADNSAYVCGAEGYVHIPIPWKPPRPSVYHIAYSTPPRQDVASGMPVRPPKEDFTVESPAELYALEADDFAAALKGEIPPAISAEQSIGNMRVLDEIRKQIGLKF
ncbi:MAG TPA: Gfo/Idh/MocA family oxidoreductase [Tepidisphaeraceae bacterium]|nr:Gfo/Idh/MocA family oxidoreductase [Tepidisphaeraceae bacterium]